MIYISFQKAVAEILRPPFVEFCRIIFCRGPPSYLNFRNSNTEERTLKNYKENDYALNRYSQGIVYKFTDGIVEVTLEDYLRDNPNKTEEDFKKLKALSDAIYYEQDRQDQRTGRRNVSMSGMEETDLAATPAIDGELIRKMEERKALDAAKRLLHSGKLTQVQKRRFLLYFFQGLSTRQIARLEGVHQRAVWDSLMWAEKKLKRLYEENDLL